MRFLQTEWHRHERDRNAWEIEKQEMKSRIANLEGQARRSDATQKALKKYVAILEKKVKDQAAQLKGGKPATPEPEHANPDRSALLEEKLRCMSLSLVARALSCCLCANHLDSTSIDRQTPGPGSCCEPAPHRARPARGRVGASRPQDVPRPVPSRIHISHDHAREPHAAQGVAVSSHD